MAVTYDFGKCGNCGDNNSKSTQVCRSCSAPLPWAKQQPVKVQSSGRSGFDLGNLAFGAIGVWILGGTLVAGSVAAIAFGYTSFNYGARMMGKIGIAIGFAVCRFAATMDN